MNNKNVLLLSSLVLGFMALIIGFPEDHPERSFVSILIGYTLIDVAFMAMARTAVVLLALTRTNSLSLILYESFVLFKIIFRILIEDVDELAVIQFKDELFYFGCLFAFLVGLVEVRAGISHARSEAQFTPLIDSEEESSESPNNKVTVSKLLGLVRGEKLLLTSAITCLVVAAIAQAAIPHYIGQALDSVKEGVSASDSLWGLFYSTVIMALFATLRGSSFILLGARVNVNLRCALFKAILRQDMGFFDTTKTGELSSRLTQDVQKVCDQVQLNVNYFVRHLISTLVTIGFMLGLSWRLTCLAMISIPFTAVLVHKYGEIMKEISKEIQDKLADCNAASEETLSSIRTVRAFAADDLEATRFASLLTGVYKASKKSAITSIPYMTLSRALPYWSLLLIVFYGAKLAMARVIEAGALISFVLYLDVLNGSFSAMGDIYGSITAALGAADKVFGLLEKQPSFEQTEYPVVSTEFGVSGSIELRNVALSYPSRPNVPVLNGMSLKIPAGSVTALVGGSGQGKSSCLSLILRWYMQDQGEVLLDGYPVRRFPPHMYHQTVTCVNQEPLLFARSIRENILFGLLNPGEAVSEELERRVIESAKLANAHDFIVSLPNGYETQVGMRGVQLSGGQKQRIAIARALVRRPKILLLDEATSALDAESEQQVQRALESMMNQDLTMIIVAHRLSTVRHADLIYVVDKGRVAEQGTHEQLIRDKQSSYYKLVNSQLANDTSG